MQGLAAMLVKGRSASTDEKYHNAFERVRKWAEKAGVCALPMLPFAWMRYMRAMFQYGQSKGLARGNLDMASAAVERMHKIAGHASATEDYGAQEVRRSMGRELGVRGRQANGRWKMRWWRSCLCGCWRCQRQRGWILGYVCWL